MSKLTPLVVLSLCALCAVICFTPRAQGAQAPVHTAAAALPFNDGFESGALGADWATHSSDGAGRILVTTDNGPHAGSYHVTMDRSPGGTHTLNELILTVDLAGRTDVALKFQHRQFEDEPDPMPESFSGHSNSDGVAISADGNEWHRVVDLSAGATFYSEYTVDLDAAAATAGIAFNSSFQIKFQQYDDFPIAADGFAFDDVSVEEPVPTPTIASITPNSSPNDGTVEITHLAGSSFRHGASVALERTGESPIEAEHVSVLGSGKITCSLDLTGAATGAWDVVVTNPGGDPGRLNDGFTVTAGDTHFATIGAGASSTSFPMGTSHEDQRTQVIYLAGEIGLAGTITSVALDVTTAPGQTMNNWTIRMRHTAKSSYPATPYWEHSGWSVVYQGNESPGAAGRRRFDLSAPFDYNGVNNLMIDLSFNNTSASTDGLCRYSVPGDTRTITASADSDHGDPLTWAGANDPTPTPSDKVPNIQLGLADVHDPSVTPADPGIAATRLAGDATKADVTITKSDDDPLGCTHYRLYRRSMNPGTWEELADIPATGADTYDYRDTGLSATASYRYGVRAYNDRRASHFVTCAVNDPWVTPGDPDIAATRLAGDATKADVTITKSPDDPDNCTHYKLYRLQANPGAWEEIANIPATGEATYSYEDSGLSETASYRYGVRAYNGYRSSKFVMCVLRDAAITPRDPGITARRVAGDATEADITISKSPDDPDGCTSYKLYRRMTSPAGAWQEVTTIEATGAASYPYHDTGLSETASYSYGVRAYNGARASAFVVCPLEDALGPDPSITPGDPELAAVRDADDATKADVTITKSPDDPDGCTNYRLYRQRVKPVSAWEEIADIPAAGAHTYEHEDTGIDETASYRYGVRAFNGYKASGFVVCVLREPDMTPGEPEIAATRVAGTPREADIVITKSPDDPLACTSYKLYRHRLQPATKWMEIATIPATGAATYVHRDTGLHPTDGYRYGTRAFNDYNRSGFVGCTLQDAE